MDFVPTFASIFWFFWFWVLISLQCYKIEFMRSYKKNLTCWILSWAIYPKFLAILIIYQPFPVITIDFIWGITTTISHCFEVYICFLFQVISPFSIPNLTPLLYCIVHIRTLWKLKLVLYVIPNVGEDFFLGGKRRQRVYAKVTFSFIKTFRFLSTCIWSHFSTFNGMHLSIN